MSHHTNTPTESNANEQILDLTIQLESMQQELSLLNLEKLEYQKELNELREVNQALMETKNEYYQVAEIEQKEIIYLRQVSINADQENNDLQSQNYQYQQIIKHLKSENESLQKENEKYKSILEQLTEQSQKKDEIHSNHVSTMENKLKQLQLENDQLRQEISETTIPNMTIDIRENGDIDLESMSPLMDIEYDIPDLDDGDIQKRKYSLTVPESEYDQDLSMMMMEEKEQDLTMIDRDQEHDHEFNQIIIHQLVQFGYDEEEIILAMRMVTDKMDINEIQDKLELERSVNYAYEALLKQQISEQHLKISKDKVKIRKLIQRNQELKSKNEKLLLIHSAKQSAQENGCTTFSWRWW